MHELQDMQRLKRESVALQSDFVQNELNLAQTFCHAALTADQDDRAWRNLAYAHRACATANKFAEHILLNGGTLSKEMRDQLREVSSQIKRLSLRLHADFD